MANWVYKNLEEQEGKRNHTPQCIQYCSSECSLNRTASICCMSYALQGSSFGNSSFPITLQVDLMLRQKIHNCLPSLSTMTLCSGRATSERRMLQIPSQWCPMSTQFTGETCTEGMKAKRGTVTHKGKKGKVTS